MKKVISVILAMLLFVGTFSLSIHAQDATENLRIAVASDLHFKSPGEKLEGPEPPINDSIYWYANRRAAMEYESGFIIDAFLNQCADSDVDYILISGDLVDNGRTVRSDHEKVAQKFAAFEERTGKQVFVINGNHDFGQAPDTDFHDFKEIYADFGYNEALTVDPDSCSYTANLGEKYRLIALDSCDYTKSTEDGMTLSKLRFVKKEADNAKKDGRYPIVMMHHNLLDHMPIQRIVSRNFIVRFHLTTADLFANWGIRVVLSGHEHCSDAASYTSSLGNKIYDFATTSLTMFPLAYRTFTFNENTIAYEDVNVDKIDTDALQNSVEGYSSAQIESMNEDLNAYAKGFLKKGVEYRLWLSMTMEKMGIQETDFYYNAARTVFDRLNELLSMPLYGENSIQALAKEYNIQLPKTDYTNAWDLATDFVAWHYAGEEPFSLDSTEFTTFLKVANLILHDDLATFNDQFLLKGANALLDKFGTNSIATDLTKRICNQYGAVTAGEVFILAIVSPFLYEFAFDADPVNDNRGTMDGYGIHNNLQNLSQKAPDFISRILAFLQSAYAMFFPQTVVLR